LGTLILTFSVIDLIFLVDQSSYTATGTSSGFSGIAIVIIISKISKPSIYIDWTLAGLLCVLVGALFHADETLVSPDLLIAGCISLSAAAVTRIWIGVTAFPPSAGSWLFISSCFAVAGSMWVLIGTIANWPVTPRLVLICDTFVLGLCVLGFASCVSSSRQD
jgi:hypothetical protein